MVDEACALDMARRLNAIFLHLHELLAAVFVVLDAFSSRSRTDLAHQDQNRISAWRMSLAGTSEVSG